MSLVQEQSEFLKDLILLLQFIYRKGWIVTGGELFRPQEMQELYYRRGLTKTLKSWHKHKLAIDLNFFKPVPAISTGKDIVVVNNRKYQLTYNKKELQIFGDFWESLNRKNRWGGNFKFVDVIHFERRPRIGKKKK
ncbi:MAG: M15 family metallopeptidase [Aquificae bacterium]|nr:M15 family metallopeptidase [Aquificota bacterium]